MRTTISWPVEVYQMAIYLAKRLTDGNLSALVRLLVEMATKERESEGRRGTDSSKGIG